MKSEIKQVQPVAYQALTRAMKQNHLAHAYLFHGPKGTLKKDTAIFLAQSLNCKEEEACEECDACRRIKEGTFSDVIYLSGEQTSIKKEDVLKLQQELNKTALEENGRKLYIIDRMENATPEAQNSLLKFLEEPANDRTAILLVEQLDRVLPTIVSRCQIVSFHPLSKSVCYEACKEKGMDELDAYLLSQLSRNAHVCEELLESETYQIARYTWKTSIEQLFHSVDDALLTLQLEGLTKKNKEEKKWFHDVVTFYYMILEDSLKDEVLCQDSWYQTQIRQMKEKQIDVGAILAILLEADDLLLRSVNVGMLVDHTMYQIKEVLK